MGSRYVLSKWKKTQALLRNPELSHHIPETRKYEYSALKEMLDQYGMVYAKPDVGTFGHGVIRIEANSRVSGTVYTYQSGKKKYEFPDYGSMKASIDELTNGRLYLVQKGINLLKYDDKMFDLRVMVQLNEKRAWITTGVIGRIGHPEKIVTNYHNGGIIEKVETLLSPYLTQNDIASFMDSIDMFGKKVAATMQAKYPKILEIGIDVALDRTMKPWILEVNTKPDPYIFKFLDNRVKMERIMKYYKLNKRR